MLTFVKDMILKWSGPIERHLATVAVGALAVWLNSKGIGLDATTTDALNVGLVGVGGAVLTWALSDHRNTITLGAIKAAVTDPQFVGVPLMVRLDNKGTFGTITPHEDNHPSDEVAPSKQPAVPPLPARNDQHHY